MSSLGACLHWAGLSSPPRFSSTWTTTTTSTTTQPRQRHRLALRSKHVNAAPSSCCGEAPPQIDDAVVLSSASASSASLSLSLSLADYAPVSRRLARQAQSPHALQSPARFAAWPAAGHECGMASCKLSPTAKPGRGFRRARLYAELGRRGLNAATRQDYIKSWPPPPWRPSTLFYTSDWVLPSFLPALLACFLPSFLLSFLPSLLPLIKSAPSVALLHHSLRFASPFATTLFPLLSFTPVLARLGRYANLLRLAA